LKLTISQKMLAARSGRAHVSAGDMVVVRVDRAMATDATAPLAISAFREMGGKKVWDPKRVILVIDHAAPAPNERIANLHQLMRNFAKEQSCQLYDEGQGIAHHLMWENGHAAPGELVIGADSHTCTYGAWGSWATGVGSTDLAAVMLTGKTWLRVPDSVKISLDGSLRPGVTAKDVALTILGEIGAGSLNYLALEYHGSWTRTLDIAARITLANLASEMGAKVGLVHPDGLDHASANSAFRPDIGARYLRELSFDVSEVLPQVSLPGSPAAVQDIASLQGHVPITLAFIGTCTNTRAEDLRSAAQVIHGRKVAPHVRFMIAPATAGVMDQIIADGTYKILREAGAVFLPAGCGSCVGTHMGIPADGEVVISAEFCWPDG
jgi:3-isopropylmalate/(R)-2-methylmalate dehydratase large subunit